MTNQDAYHLEEANKTMRAAVAEDCAQAPQLLEGHGLFPVDAGREYFSNLSLSQDLKPIYQETMSAPSHNPTTRVN